MLNPQHPPIGHDGVRPRVDLRKSAGSLPADDRRPTQVNLVKTPAAASPPPQPYHSSAPGRSSLAAHVPPRGSNPASTADRIRFNPALLALAGVGVVAVLAFGGFLMFGGEDSERGGTLRPDAQSSSVHAPPSNTYTSTAAAPTSQKITFNGMRDFVIMHYADLPADPAATWKRLDPHFVARVAWDDYVSFWSTIESVSVNSVTPRGPDSVFVRLTYVHRNGRTSAEDRWLSFTSNAAGLRVHESERVGSVP